MLNSVTDKMRDFRDNTVDFFLDTTKTALTGFGSFLGGLVLPAAWGVAEAATTNRSDLWERVEESYEAGWPFSAAGVTVALFMIAGHELAKKYDQRREERRARATAEENAKWRAQSNGRGPFIGGYNA